jgi:tetratricopeptide (TPR) repeat protein
MPARRRALTFLNILCAGLFWAIATNAPAAEVEANSRYREGLKAFRSGDYPAAEEAFKLCIRAEPLQPKYRLALAHLYHELFDKFHAFYPEAREAYGELDLLLGANPPALQDRGMLASYYDQGLLLLEGGEPATALISLTRFLQLYPDYYDAERVHNARGVALFRLSRFEEAADEFRASIELNPGLLEPRANLRSVYIRLNMFEQARYSHRIGRLDDAMDTVDSLLRIANGYLPAMRLRADIFRDLGKKEDALCAYQAVLAANPEDPITHGVRLEMAKIVEADGDPRGALQLLNDNARRFRNIDNDPTMREVFRLVRKLKENP